VLSFKQWQQQQQQQQQQQHQHAAFSLHHCMAIPAVQNEDTTPTISTPTL
jgi:hypothetical protein